MTEHDGCEWWCERYANAIPEAKKMYYITDGHVDLNAVQPQAPQEALVTAIVRLTEAIDEAR